MVIYEARREKGLELCRSLSCPRALRMVHPFFVICETGVQKEEELQKIEKKVQSRKDGLKQMVCWAWERTGTSRYNKHGREKKKGMTEG